MKTMMRNCIKKAGVLCAVATMAVALLTVTGAQPASAANCGKLTLYYHSDEGQVDNCPGNAPDHTGAWAWVWNGVGNGMGVYIDLTFENGGTDNVGVANTKGASNAVTFGFFGAITKARLCTYFLYRSLDLQCQGWQTVH